MFKKPFNKVEGETRVCKGCNDEFHTRKPVWFCRHCLNEKSKKLQRLKAGDGNVTTGRFKGMAPKKPYPFDTRSNKPLSRFRRIKRELNKCNTKEERRLHYQKQLEEIKLNGVWDWIFDRRDDETANERVIKSRNRTRTDFPDTRGYYEE